MEGVRAESWTNEWYDHITRTLASYTSSQCVLKLLAVSLHNSLSQGASPTSLRSSIKNDVPHIPLSRCSHISYNLAEFFRTANREPACSPVRLFGNVLNHNNEGIQSYMSGRVEEAFSLWARSLALLTGHDCSQTLWNNTLARWRLGHIDPHTALSILQSAAHRDEISMQDFEEMRQAILSEAFFGKKNETVELPLHVINSHSGQFRLRVADDDTLHLHTEKFLYVFDCKNNFSCEKVLHLEPHKMYTASGNGCTLLIILCFLGLNHSFYHLSSNRKSKIVVFLGRGMVRSTE